MNRSGSMAVWVLLALAACARAQVPFDPARHPKLVALLDSRSPEETAIGCEVHPLPPQLNFDFRFAGGYAVYIPLKRYSGKGNRFTVITRVVAQESGSQPVYLIQSVGLPDVPSKNKAYIQLMGGYFMGEGKYTADLLLVDQADRTCRKHWRLEARRSGMTKQIPVTIQPGRVAPLTFVTWKRMLAQQKGSDANLPRLTVLFHVAPLFRRSTTLRLSDEQLLLDSLASLLEQIPYSRVKLVAFNLDQQKELYREDSFDGTGWDQLLGAIEKLQLGTVSYDVLTRKTGHADLLKKLVGEELRKEQHSDAVIFLGPTARQMEKPAALPQREDRSLAPQFFYFEYKPYWYRTAEFPDVVYYVTRALNGKVFRIHSPSEFASAIKGLRSSIQEKSAAGSE